MRRRGAHLSVCAFSLVELLVTMAVVTVLMTIIVGMIDQSSKAWKDAEREGDAFRDARAALYFLVKDLETMLPSTTRDFCFFDQNKLGQTVVKLPNSLPPPDADGRGQSLFFYSTQASESQPEGTPGSHLCLMGFFTAFSADGVGASSSSYKLHRFFRSSDETFTLIRQFAQGGLLADASDLAQNEEVLAGNILDFQLTPMERAPTGELQAFSGAVQAWPKNRMPKAIDVSFISLGRDGGRSLGKTKAEWDSPNPNILRRTGRTFTKRILLRNENPAY